MRLSPRDPTLARMLLYKAEALEVLGRDAEASVLLNQALALTRTIVKYCGFKRPRSPISDVTPKRANSTDATPR
jgi:hypothetical protein